MKLNIEREDARAGVMNCLANIVDDFELGIEHKEYAIFVPVTSFSGNEIEVGDHREVIVKPKTVYRQIVLKGQDFVADVYTKEILRKYTQ